MGLPFGWSPAPAIFTKFVRQILHALRYPLSIQHTLPCIIRDKFFELGDYFVTAFLDDILGIGCSYDETKLLCSAILELLSSLAILFHSHKCDL